MSGEQYKPPELPDSAELEYRRLVEQSGWPGGLSPIESARLAELARLLEMRREFAERFRKLPRHGPPG